VAGDQNRIREIASALRAAIGGHATPARARDLATSVLGTRHPDDRDYAVHMDYIHFNPVKHGLAASPDEWPLSTFKQAVAAGMYPQNWLPLSVQLDDTGEPQMR
jgi:putative transposase